MAAENGVVNVVNEVNEGVAVREPTTIVPVTAAIYHNGQEKPTERLSLELGLTLSEDKHNSYCQQKEYYSLGASYLNVNNKGK